MPHDDFVPPGSPQGGGALKNLSPRQKRIAAVAGVAAVLALIYLLSRRQEATQPATDPTAADQAAADQAAAGGGGSLPPYDFSGDQSGYLAQIGSELQASLSTLGAGLHSKIGMLQGQVHQLRRQEEKWHHRHPGGGGRGRHPGGHGGGGHHHRRGAGRLGRATPGR